MDEMTVLGDADMKALAAFVSRLHKSPSDNDRALAGGISLLLAGYGLEMSVELFRLMLDWEITKAMKQTGPDFDKLLRWSKRDSN